MRVLYFALISLALAASLISQRVRGQTAPLPPALPGIHNLQRVTDKLLSGSNPEGDAGFASLRALGVKTIISVDGARPDLERAHTLGMRYVHVPVGYNGVPAEQGLRIARAVRDLPGLVYIHCHHGKHRGPAAAAVARRCLDPTCTAEVALEFMKRAGTDKRYAGLYDSVARIKPDAHALARTPADFPEHAKVSDLARAMVEIDEHFEGLKLASKAGWKTPPDHPDIDPAHEAKLLADNFQEARHATKEQRLAQRLADTETHARTLAELLRLSNGDPPREKLAGAFARMASDCSSCHALHRD